MRNRKKIIISIFSLALCVLISFAWINELQIPTGRVLHLRFENAAIADSNLRVALSEMNEADESFDPITKFYDENAEPDLAAYEDFAPGARRKFRIDITNLGDSSLRLSVILSNIICENEELQDCIIIGTNGFDGFSSDYPAPMVQTKMLSDGMDASGGFTLVDLVEIPPYSKDEQGNEKFVSIYFYVMFSASGSANLEDKSFSIGKISFLTV